MRSREPAQNLAEYALLVAGIGLVVLVLAGLFGESLRAWFLELVQRITANT